MTTIPSCEHCNGGLGPDEEYFIAATAHVAFTERLRRRIQPGGDLHESLYRRDGSLVRRIEAAHAPDESGRLWLQPELERFERVAAKIIAGLYYRRFGQRLGLSDVRDVQVHHANNLPAEALVRSHTESFTPKQWSHVQKGTFRYIFVRGQDSASRLYCQFLVYETVYAEGTCPSPQGQRRPRLLSGQMSLGLPDSSYGRVKHT